MQDQPNRTAGERAGRAVSAVWLLYGIYLLSLGWLAFGSHAPDVEQSLASLGIRQVHEESYVVKGSSFIGSYVSFLGGDRVETVKRYGPNYGGVLLYALGGGFVAYYFSRPDRQASRVNQENALPHGGTQDQG